jgi:hypothetical protein
MDNGILRSLETLICSGFESKHKRIVSAIVTVWNSTFGSEPDLEYPPRVTEAILRLRPIADIRLPSFPDHHRNEVCVFETNTEIRLLTEQTVSTGPTFEDESQEDNLPYGLEDYNISRSSTSRERTPHLEPSPLPQLGRRASPNMLVDLPHSGSRKRAFQGTPENNKRKVAKKNLTPKLRHDDSQVQFAAIDSSPLADAVLDSQLLTDRQREVKERQRETGAMFANIGISPRFRTESGLSNLTPGSDPPALKQTSPDDPSTPDLPLREKATFDEYITSSPTPRRGGFRVQMNIDLTDPPSSSPEQSLPMANTRIFVSGNSRRDVDRSNSDIWEVTSSPPVRSQDVSRTSTDLGPSAQVVEDLIVTEADHDTSMIGNSMEDDGLTGPLERPSTPLETHGSLALERQASRTPNEVFVDALSSPAPPTPVKDINSDQLSIDGMEDDQRGLAPSLVKQNDSQIAYSLSEADEDSMLRLISKFDKPGPRHDHTNNEMDGDDNVMEPDSLAGGMGDCPAANINQHKMAVPLSTTSEQSNSQSLGSTSVASEPQGKQPTIIKPLRTNSKIKKLTQTSPTFDNAIATSTVLEAQDKNTSKHNRRSTTMKRKIIDERAKVPNSLAVETIGKTSQAISSNTTILITSSGSTTKSRETGMDPETSSHGLEYDESMISNAAEAGQRTSTHLDKQIPDVRDVTIDSDSHMSLFNSKSKDGELPVVPTHIQSVETAGQKTKETCDRWDKATYTTSVVPSAREVGVGERGAKVIGKFEEILASLRAVALTREEAQKVENLLWDVKGELYAAEKRGRVEG